MDLKQYLDTLTILEREAFAARCGTTVAYLAQLTGGHRLPSPKLARKFVVESGKKISLAKLRPDIWSRVA